MGTVVTKADKHQERAPEPAMSPERRLDAIADILARGLARVLLAETSGAGADDADAPQRAATILETSLIDTRERAFMDSRGEEAAEEG